MNMHMTREIKLELLKCSMGKTNADLCVTNAMLVNVFTGEIYKANVYVKCGFIAHIETENFNDEIKAEKIIDAEGSYLIPGFIDSHIHIESSMLTPINFCKCVIRHGTTTVITDPHELANVFGKEAVRYMHDSSNNLPMRQLIDIPSCIPSVPNLENAGATFLADDIEELSSLDRVIGLAEVMDYIAVINGEDRMLNIIETCEKKGLYIQGHAPYLKGRELSAYLIGGPKTCHESRTQEEFRNKLRNGMFVDVRESSISRNTKAAVDSVKNMKFLDNFCVCTDDREADDILYDGHMNVVVERLVGHGMDELIAIKAATLNNARAAKLYNIGAIAPGYIADMQLVKDLKKPKPHKVFFEGNLVVDDGKILVDIKDIDFDIEKKNSINVKLLTKDMFIYKVNGEFINKTDNTVKTSIMKYDTFKFSGTTLSEEYLPVKNGVLDITNDKDLKYVMVINRYGKGTVGYGVVRGFGTNKGAICSTISHDCHNITVVFDTPENGFLAVDQLIKQGGGMVSVIDGEVRQTLPLEIGGLMTKKPADELAVISKKMKASLVEMGLDKIENPLLRIVTLALPVIPTIKMSDLGIVDVLEKKILPLYEKI